MVVLAEPGQPLTARERECLTSAASGRKAAETASIVGLSIHTVRQHLFAARIKLGAANTAQACVLLDRGQRPNSQRG